MKKNDWILIISVILYTFLFYNQFAGVNFLIFNIALVIGLYLKDKSVLQTSNWKISAVFSLLTSIAITIYGNGIAVFANVIALSLLSAYSLKIKNSFLFSVAFSFYSYASSIFYIVLDWQRRNTAETERSLPSVKETFLIVIPVLIALVFLFIYRASNPLFNDFIEKINLEFISFELIFFTILGFIILYGFYYHRKINYISQWDENSKQTISDIADPRTTLFGRTLTQSDELYSGKLLFVLLNLMILVINILDFEFLFISHQLPVGITYSQFVHQGTGALIFSIVISIFIILFYFRGGINFSSKSKFIKMLAYLWIIQNVIMLISTALRNGMYIEEYGLTYKRIGVYTYLLLTIIGLVTTFVKIRNFKTASYLIRINSWLFYGVLAVSCFVNWDLLITNYNMKYSGKQSKEYLASLSETNLPQLYLLEMGRSKSIQPAADTIARDNIRFEKHLSSKHFEFNTKDEKMSWRSWNYDHIRVKNELLELNLNSTISILRLPGRGLYNLDVMRGLWNLTSLDVSSNHIESISAITIFPGLIELNISGNRLKNLNGIENLNKLEYLDLSGNFITDYSPLHSLKNLKKLKLPHSISPSQMEGILIKLPEIILIKS